MLGMTDPGSVISLSRGLEQPIRPDFSGRCDDSRKSAPYARGMASAIHLVTNSEAEVGAALTVEIGKTIDFAPELDWIDVEPLEQRSLHVARDQGSIEIPDEGDRALGEECAGHHQ